MNIRTYDRLLDEQSKRVRVKFSLEIIEQQTKYEQKLSIIKREGRKYVKQGIEKLKRNFDKKIEYLQKIPKQKV
ncbi:unnamed protein product [Didymodactylos carnosus]|uniref:Uncharacterized protein n=1 Tax=Didymodactylos carnosus TaxID=1234261 RepID=A0A8S2D7L0_9BILA|nr:unnamed protein product [Didymodactylos carnosus]CAF0832368.1 unnamed protein product [Didymodactylos carnosus]CAF3616933.1 unnamed protein product [Didymodactylos carnosus]CAF3616953.1 unnamed protein product [Didymodactylos carnosus]